MRFSCDVGIVSPALKVCYHAQELAENNDTEEELIELI
jgi:hypothetical protein